MDDIKIKTMIILDPCDYPDRESGAIVNELKLLGIDCKPLEVSEGAYALVKSPKQDLVVIDYGGMMWGAQDTAASNIRYVCQWAVDHPSAVVIIWTQFTEEIYRDELSEAFGNVDNVVHRYNSLSENPEWVSKVKLRLGL